MGVDRGNPTQENWGYLNIQSDAELTQVVSKEI
jgi:hypothetical protein